MQTARVLGSIVSTTKHESFVGQRLILVQPLLVDGTADGPPLVALGLLGSRKGDNVILTSDGTLARELTGDENTPSRWSVMGVVDS